MEKLSKFKDDVDRIMGNILKIHDFTLEDSGSNNNDMYPYLIYKSPSGRIKIYDDWRNGEINCQMQMLKQNSEYGNWYYIRGLSLVNKGKTREELLREVTINPISSEDQINDIKNIFEENIITIWKEISKRS